METIYVQFCFDILFLGLFFSLFIFACLYDVSLVHE